MKLKKYKKRNKSKYLILILITYIIFIYTIYYSFKNNNLLLNEKYINYLLTSGNPLLNNEYKFSNLFNKSLSYLLNIDFTKPVSLFNTSILGYEEEDYENLDKLKQISSYIEDPHKVDLSNPLIYLYNSHQLENYNNDNLSLYGITPNVLMASYLLKEKLNNLGISTIVEDTNLTEFLELNNLNYTNSYQVSRIFLLDKINTYPSLKYFIDIHRDSISKEESTITINGNKYAKILFVIGLENPNYQNNLDLSTKLNNLFNIYYKGLSRGILKKEGENVNGIYNQDVSSNCLLIEVGGVDNNIDEVLNTINAITDILSRYLNE